MIKLKNIIELDSLVYCKTIKPKHKESMNSSYGIFTGFNINQFMSSPPSKNSSRETFKDLLNIEKIVSNEDVKKPDNVKNYFKDYFTDMELDYPDVEVKEIMKDVKGIIYNLKYNYNRPRPSQIAKSYGLKFHGKPLKTANTPSYPSGHAIQGTLVSRFLADKHPAHADDIIKLGDDITKSRLIAKVHFLSDSTFGVSIGEALFNFLQKKL